MEAPREYSTVYLPMAKGAKGAAVTLAQEWLCLNDCRLVIDGQYGPATEATVRKFQTKAHLTPTGIIDDDTWRALTLPLFRAIRPLSTTAETFSQRVVAAARQHLREHPREVGGQNRGPWVRLYMSGKQGPEFPWCAGFVSYLLAQASKRDKREKNSKKRVDPIPYTYSCDILAEQARITGSLITETDISKDPTKRSLIRPGSIFLVRAGKRSTDYIHTGIVTVVSDDYIETIEGNTNDNGEAEGYEVCKRLRGYELKDFILL